MRIVRKSLQSTGPTLPGMEISETVEHTTSNPLISFVAASPARTSAMQANEQGLKANVVDSGKSSTVSFANYNLSTSSWKTSQLCFTGELNEFSETWPRAGMMLNGKCYQQKPLVRHTSERESSLLPTPRANKITGYSSEGWGATLVQRLLTLPTPTANDGKGSGRKRYRGSKHFRGAKISEALRTCVADPIYPHPSFVEIVMGYP